MSNDLVAAAGNETDYYETPEVESVGPGHAEGGDRGDGAARARASALLEPAHHRLLVPGPPAGHPRDGEEARRHRRLCDEGVLYRQPFHDERSGRQVSEALLDEDRAMELGYLE